MTTLSQATITDLLQQIEDGNGLFLTSPAYVKKLIKTLCENVIDARRFAEDLRAQIRDAVVQVVYCVYCGNEYPAGTPQAKSQVLYDHIKTCDKHPLPPLLEIVRALGIWRHEGMGAPLEAARLYDVWAKTWAKEFT